MVTISIRMARKRKGLTQAELAKLMGVHQTNIVAWENGKWSPRARHLPKLASILETTVDELLATEEAKDV